MKRYVSRAEAARILGVHGTTIDSYVKRGLLKRYRNEANGRPVFDREQLAALARPIEEDNE